VHFYRGNTQKKRSKKSAFLKSTKFNFSRFTPRKQPFLKSQKFQILTILDLKNMTNFSKKGTLLTIKRVFWQNLGKMKPNQKTEKVTKI